VTVPRLFWCHISSIEPPSHSMVDLPIFASMALLTTTSAVIVPVAESHLT
jgi:hypothetical protein